MINKTTFWIPVGLIGASVPMHFVTNVLPFISARIATWTFRLGAIIGATVILLEIAGQTNKYLDETFIKTWRERKQSKDKIKQEQGRIKQLLEFDPEGKAIDDVQNHFDTLQDEKFSKESFGPYSVEWHSHVSQIDSALSDHYAKQRQIQHEREVQEKKKELEELNDQKERLEESEEDRERSEQEEFMEEYQDRITINVEYMEEKERQWLEEAGYQKDYQWDPEEKESVEVMTKPRNNESKSHAYLVGFLQKYLQDELCRADVEIFETKMPDIVFNSSGYKWAVEIETGSQLRKNGKEFQEKVKMLNEKFKDAWFFVVTNKNLVQKYKKYGPTFDRSKVLDHIEGIIWPEGRPD